MSNCTTLSSRTSFPAYISTLRNTTHNDFRRVDACRLQVCGALWGTGNPDVSGIGMAVGYLLETFIATGLLCIFAWMRRQRRQRGRVVPTRLKLLNVLVATAARTFYDTAAFFTFAIQTACIVTLTRVDFGISASGMGALTMEIVWLVSSLTMLPLLPLVLETRIYQDDLGGVAGSEALMEDASVAGGSSEQRKEDCSDRAVQRNDFESAARQDLRFLSFVICWAMAFCPFFSRMSGTFGKIYVHCVVLKAEYITGQSRIGDGRDSSISTADWRLIENVCFRDVQRIERPLETLLTACGIMSYLLLSAIVIGKIAWTLTEEYRARWFVWTTKPGRISQAWISRCYTTMCAIVLALLIIQFWGFYRVRQVQKDMTLAAGGDFSDGEWTFGQIVAVIVFLPVFVELAFVWRQDSRHEA